MTVLLVHIVNGLFIKRIEKVSFCTSQESLELSNKLEEFYNNVPFAPPDINFTQPIPTFMVVFAVSTEI